MKLFPDNTAVCAHTFLRGTYIIQIHFFLFFTYEDFYKIQEENECIYNYILLIEKLWKIEYLDYVYSYFIAFFVHVVELKVFCFRGRKIIDMRDSVLFYSGLWNEWIWISRTGLGVYFSWYFLNCYPFLERALLLVL